MMKKFSFIGLSVCLLCACEKAGVIDKSDPELLSITDGLASSQESDPSIKLNASKCAEALEKRKRRSICYDLAFRLKNLTVLVSALRRQACMTELLADFNSGSMKADFATDLPVISKYQLA